MKNEHRYWQVLEAYGQAIYPNLQPKVYGIEGSPGAYQVHYEVPEEPTVELREEANLAMTRWALDHLDVAMDAPEPFDATKFVRAHL